MWNHGHFWQTCGPTGRCVRCQTLSALWMVVEWMFHRVNPKSSPITAPFDRRSSLIIDQEDIGCVDVTDRGCFKEWLDAARLSEDELGFCEFEMPLELERGVCRIDARNAGSGTDYG